MCDACVLPGCCWGQTVSAESSPAQASSDDPFLRTRPGVIEESAIQRASQRRQETSSSTSGSGGGSSEGGFGGQLSSLHQASSSSSAPPIAGNAILERELAQVAEAKRVSEQEASGVCVCVRVFVCLSTFYHYSTVCTNALQRLTR